ncbi:MAG: hypothetical protein H7841_15405 [Magnetospirillum sp. WYHS-4]
MGEAGIDEFCKDADDERRGMCRVLKRWIARLRGESFPAFRELDVTAAPAVADHVFVLDATDDEGRWTVESCGIDVAAICRHQPVGRSVAEVFPMPLAEALPHLSKNVMAYKKPISDSGSAYGPRGELLYRCILMPLSNDGQGIDRVLGSLTWRYVKDR